MSESTLVSFVLLVAATCIGVALLILLLAVCAGVQQAIPRWRRAKSWQSFVRKDGAKPLLLVCGILLGLFVGLYVLNFEDVQY